MIGGLISIGLWLLSFFTKPASKDAAIKQSGAVEVQKDEAVNAVKKIEQADDIRDAVRSQPVGGLRDDPGNLYRD